MEDSRPKTGSDLFIVNNSDDDWKVVDYLREWTQISNAFDIATGFLKSGRCRRWTVIGSNSKLSAQEKTARFFHAKDDVPEVRLHVFRVLPQHGVRFSAVVKDKLALLEAVRARLTAEPGYRYRADGHELYDSMMRSLFARVGRLGHHRHITFAVRGNRPRTQVLTAALTEVEREFESKFGLSPHKETTVRSAYPWEHAGLQACDYFLWALQRFYERGEERFLGAMWQQFVEVIDLDLPAPKRRGKPRGNSVIFNEEHSLTLESRAGVGMRCREIQGEPNHHTARGRFLSPDRRSLAQIREQRIRKSQAVDTYGNPFLSRPVWHHSCQVA